MKPYLYNLRPVLSVAFGCALIVILIIGIVREFHEFRAAGLSLNPFNQ